MPSVFAATIFKFALTKSIHAPILVPILASLTLRRCFMSMGCRDLSRRTAFTRRSKNEQP